MSGPDVSLDDAIILVLASFGNDAGTLARHVEQAGRRARICSAPEDFCQAFDDSVAALVATEESLLDAEAALRACLDTQPAWSDLPVLILTGRQVRHDAPARWKFFRQFGNVTVLARPMTGETLNVALEAACRARAWQYVVREQMRRLEAQNTGLEMEVREGIRALQAESEHRKRIESALNEARRLEAIGRLTGGVAHDFNNLLQVIDSACTLLRFAGSDGERGSALLDTIQRATDRGARLTQQMLAFGRRQVLSTDAVDIAQRINEMKELLQQSLREKITLELRLQPDLWPARTDATQLEVALLNLTVNAKDVLPNGGKVTLAASNVRLPDAHFPEVPDLSGDFIWVRLADNGPGMSAEVAAQAFEPFFTTKRIGEGSGLGLSQVYGFARQSGGGAWIRSDGNGTTVSVLLPRGAEVGRRADEEAQPAEHDLAKPLQGARLLYVEDDEEVGKLIVGLLEAAGSTVHWARDAESALQTELQAFDLVFSDVQMPGAMDGIGLAQELAKRMPALPVVLASGYVVAPERIASLPVQFIRKPFDGRTLLRILHDHLA